MEKDIRGVTRNWDGPEGIMVHRRQMVTTKTATRLKCQNTQRQILSQRFLYRYMDTVSNSVSRFIFLATVNPREPRTIFAVFNI